MPNTDNYAPGDRRYPAEHPLSPEKCLAAYRTGQAYPKNLAAWMSFERANPLDAGLTAIVALYSDGSGADALTHLDGEGWVHSEDASLADLSSFGWFIASPRGFEPHFMTLTGY